MVFLLQLKLTSWLHTIVKRFYIHNNSHDESVVDSSISQVAYNIWQEVTVLSTMDPVLCEVCVCASLSVYSPAQLLYASSFIVLYCIIHVSELGRGLLFAPSTRTKTGSVLVLRLLCLSCGTGWYNGKVLMSIQSLRPLLIHWLVFCIFPVP